MNRHTQIRQAVLARLREQCGDSATFFDGLPAFIDAQELPAVAVWLSDAQYTGKMTDEDDWQAVRKRKANAVCNTCSLQTKLELLLN